MAPITRASTRDDSARPNTTILSSPRSKSSPQTFYSSTGDRLLSPLQNMRLRSPYDKEIAALFAPALIALLLEPLQQLVDTAIIGGNLGVPQLGALGLGTVLFQFALGFFASLVFATTPRVAACAAIKDYKSASQTTAQAMWLALICGTLLQALVFTKAPDIINFMSSSDMFVAGYTISYLRARSWGFPGALVMMVAIGASRGLKDMKVPLLGSAAYLGALALLDVVLVSWVGWGMEGAGYAAAAAQWTGAAVVVYLLVEKGAFDVKDMFMFSSNGIGGRKEDVAAAAAAVVVLEVESNKTSSTSPSPSPSSSFSSSLGEAIAPYAKMTLSLSVNNISALAPVLVATSMATSLGASQLAAHTILRQLTGFWLQGFIAMNATAHTLVATDISRGRADGAGRVLVRCTQLAVMGSVPVGIGLWLWGRDVLPGLFTNDVIVSAEVADILPLVLMYMPLDAMGTVLEGGLLGVADTKWIATRTMLSSVVALVALHLANTNINGEVTTLVAVWFGLKLLNLASLGLDLGRFCLPNFLFSSFSSSIAVGSMMKKKKK